jgi:hypothetical protein
MIRAVAYKMQEHVLGGLSAATRRLLSDPAKRLPPPISYRVAAEEVRTRRLKPYLRVTPQRNL